jgi:D-lactate dehydrogenase
MGLCYAVGNILCYCAHVVHRNYFSFLFELHIFNLFLFFTFNLFHYSYDAICLFVNDTADANVLRILSLLGVKMIAMRCAGFDRIDTQSAKAHGFTVARVPAYSPYAVAEHAMSLFMAVNRKICTASTRVKMANFTLDQSLIGMDIHEKTVGIMGTGKIGQILCKILNGFGAKILCYDVFENDVVKDLGAVYVTKNELYEKCDAIFLMMPLFPSTKHSINKEAISKMKKGVLIVNTARGGLIDTKAIIAGLQNGHIGGVGLDVFENEQEYFFQDWSARAIGDPDLTSLLGNNKVVMTAHQAFFTQEAVDKIVGTTLENLKEWKAGNVGQNHPNNCIFEKKKN